MSYENPIPPIPTREEEKLMISALKKSFQEQKNSKFYMNEESRLKKIENSERQNTYKINLFRNFYRGLFFSMVPSLFIAFFFRRNNGLVPKYFYGKQYTGRVFSQKNTFRNLHVFSAFLPSWLGFSYLYAKTMTNKDIVTSEYFEQTTILPY